MIEIIEKTVFWTFMKIIKALNLEQERNFEPHQRSSLVTDNWHDRKNSGLVSIDRFINSSRKDDRGLKVTERPIVIIKTTMKEKTIVKKCKR